MPPGCISLRSQIFYIFLLVTKGAALSYTNLEPPTSAIPDLTAVPIYSLLVPLVSTTGTAGRMEIYPARRTSPGTACTASAVGDHVGIYTTPAGHDHKVASSCYHFTDLGPHTAPPGGDPVLTSRTACRGFLCNTLQLLLRLRLCFCYIFPQQILLYIPIGDVSLRVFHFHLAENIVVLY